VRAATRVNSYGRVRTRRSPHLDCTLANFNSNASETWTLSNSSGNPIDVECQCGLRWTSAQGDPMVTRFKTPPRRAGVGHSVAALYTVRERWGRRGQLTGLLASNLRYPHATPSGTPLGARTSLPRAASFRDSYAITKQLRQRWDNHRDPISPPYRRSAANARSSAPLHTRKVIGLSRSPSRTPSPPLISGPTPIIDPE
jgi:hypothetical protein